MYYIPFSFLVIDFVYSNSLLPCHHGHFLVDFPLSILRNVKSGELSVDQALKRFISYEEKHKKSDSDDVPVSFAAG